MKTMLMTVLCTLAATSFAQEATPDTWMSDVRSTRTSAEVRAEAAAMLRSHGERQMLAEGYLPSVAHPRLRAEVVAELLRARDSGEFAALHAEAHDFVTPARATSFAGRHVSARQR